MHVCCKANYAKSPNILKHVKYRVYFTVICVQVSEIVTKYLQYFMMNSCVEILV